MKPVFLALVSLGFLLPLLAGCGQSTPPLTVTCTTRRLPSGVFTARVTVSNHTGTRRNAVIYGPALFWTRYVHPLMPATEVAILLPGGRRTTFIGFRVRGVPANGSSHLVVRLSPRARGTSIAVTGKTVLHAQNLELVDNPSCVIHRKP